MREMRRCEMCLCEYIDGEVGCDWCKSWHADSGLEPLDENEIGGLDFVRWGLENECDWLICLWCGSGTGGVG